MKVIVFDTETNGLTDYDRLKYKSMYDPDWVKCFPDPIQMSYIVYDCETNKIVKTRDQYFNLPDDVEFNQESFHIHQHSQAFIKRHGLPVSKQPEFLKEFIQDYESSQWAVGHNIKFDVGVIQAMIIRNGLHYIMNSSYSSQPREYCTMKLSRYILKLKAVAKNGKEYIKNPKLIELHSYLFKEDMSGLHNSMVDILCTLRCYYKMCYDRDVFTLNRQLKSILKG